MSLSMQKCSLKVAEALMNVDWIKWMYFCTNEFETGVNDSIVSGNEQQKVYLSLRRSRINFFLTTEWWRHLHPLNSSRPEE